MCDVLFSDAISAVIDGEDQIPEIVQLLPRNHVTLHLAARQESVFHVWQPP
jgi:hypothetical protein